MMLTERFSSQQREVDIIVRGQVGSHDLIVCIEVQDRKRKATIEWVEQMVMKHKLLPTSKLILVAAQGFTKTAAEKAALLGVDTYSLEEALATDWKEVLGESLSCKMYAFRVVSCSLILEDTNETTMSAGRSLGIFNENGSLHSSLGELIDKATSSIDFTERAIEFGATGDQSIFGAEMRFNSALFVKDFDGALCKIRLALVFMEMHPVQTPACFTTARYQDSAIAYSEGKLPAGEFALTLIKPTNNLPTGAFTLTNQSTGKSNTVGLQFGPNDRRLVFVTDIVNISSTDNKMT